MKKVVVFAAHPDDELLGEGGTIRRLADEGVSVHAVILAEGLTSRCIKRSDLNPLELTRLQEDARKPKKLDMLGLIFADYQIIVWMGWSY